MSKSVDRIVADIHHLTDIDKLHLVDVILADLDRPDPEIDLVWAVESRRRWEAYKAGRTPTVSYETAMAKHRSS
ncbi:MAG: addiction module protein [Chloroflexota bacterium]|nr:MAG: addiction module protein [Chloroflexota bacterium]